MSSGPSRPLLVVLALSVLAGAYVYGKPLVDGEAGEVFDEPVTPADPDLVGDDAQVGIEPWIPPAEPRNPFLQVELGGGPEDPSTGETGGA